MLRLHEITDDRLLYDLAPEWDDLLGRCSHATVFQTWEWLGMCRRYFAGVPSVRGVMGGDFEIPPHHTPRIAPHHKGKRLMTLVIRDDERLVGIAPFEIVRIYGSPLRRLRFIGTGRSDYLDIIADDGVRVEVIQAVFAWLHEHRSRWDVVDLQAIPEGVWEYGGMGVWACGSEGRSRSMDETPTLPHSHTPILSCSHTPTLLRQELCPYMPLAPTWEETVAQLGKRLRYNLGYYERLMRREFDVEIGMIGADQLDEGMDALFTLHTQRWRKRWLPGVLTGDHTRAFHRELAAGFLKRGWLRLHTLRLDGEIRAVLYCLAYKTTTCYYIGGFDPELSRFSPGTILTGYAIRRAIEDGCTEFDFLRGNEGYKARWTDHARMNGRLVIGRGGMRSATASAVCRLEMRIEHAAKEWMHRRFGRKQT